MTKESACRDTLLQYVLDWVNGTLIGDEIVAVGHRIVHGGLSLGKPMRVTPTLLDELDRLVPLAPLHQPHNLAPIRILAQKFPELAQVACFDTAFHSTQPAIARSYALPRALTDEGICSYGFHGLSYDYVTSRLMERQPELAHGRIVICHLGNGSSLCAVKDGRSMDTSMGFSALNGVPMGTRSGSIDPGVILYLMREKKMGYAELEDLLYRKSGLLGVSGISNDMKVLQDSEDPAARGAVELLPSRRPGGGSDGDLDGRPGCAGVHCRHRRELAGDPRPDRRASRVAGRQRGQRGQPHERLRDLGSGRQGAGFRGADQRRKMIARYTITVLGESMASA